MHKLALRYIKEPVPMVTAGEGEITVSVHIFKKGPSVKNPMVPGDF